MTDKITCNCRCHTNPNVKHVMPCCEYTYQQKNKMTNKKLITEIVHKKCPCRCHKPIAENMDPVEHGETPCCPQAYKTWEEAPIA